MFKFFNTFSTKPLPCAQFRTCSSLKETWEILSAVCLERGPIVTRPLNNLEEEYKSLLLKTEWEKSLKSDHEVRHEKELKQLEQLKKGDEVEVHIKETAQDYEDANNEQLSNFKFSNRISEADKKNDRKSLKRKMDKRLILVVKQQIGNDTFYLLPQSRRENGETLRQTANRIVKDTCGKGLKATIYGNAPCGFYKYKYPQEVQQQNGTVGAKVFIYFARYKQGLLETKNIDYEWLDASELQHSLPSSYVRSVLNMLIN